jgi:hypothetical protein
MMLRIASFALLATFVGALPAAAQEAFFYPKKGQSPEQLEKDKMECYSWAKGQTGFDPMTPAPTPDTSGVEAAQEAKRGSAVRGAARGAAVGAVGGAIGGDAGKGAGVGAGVGAVGGRMRSNQREQAARSDARSDYEARLAAYNEKRATWQRAASACMEGRDYSVK